MVNKNKKVLSIILSFVLILGIVIVPTDVLAAEPLQITIVHVNDVHGRLSMSESANPKEIGLGRIQTKVEELKAANPNLLLVNAGDTMHGTVDVNLSRGQIMVDLMNKMGFDAMVPGNHDFNYGYERLLELDESADFPVLGANIIKEADGKSDFEPYTIKTLENGLTVGIFGISTEETKYKANPTYTEGIEFKDGVEVAKEMVKILEDKDVDVIVALVHLGIEGTTETTSKDIAEKVKGIDLIIDGHSHEELNLPIGDTLIVQAGNHTSNIGIVNLEIVDGKIAKKEASLFTFEQAKGIVPHEMIEAEIAKGVGANAEKKAVVIGKSLVKLDGERANARTGETTLGNLITDAMKEATGAEIAFTNGGGIRASIEAGDVTYGDAVTSFPFTNFLVVIDVTGAELKAALEHGVDLYPAQAGHFSHVSGMTYKFDPNKEVGSRIVEVSVAGKTLDLAKSYRLVTNDFMSVGGDGYTMFAGKPVIAEGALLSDALIDYFNAHGEVEPKVEGRIVGVPLVKPEPIPVPTPEPVPAPTPAAIKYVVKPGDWLSKIAMKYKIDWKVLSEYNKLKNPNLIFPGQVIMIPQ